MRVQLALQGGGAKIVALIAAMEAVEELVANREMEVGRVAGTSAGSIVGALFCAGVRMNDVRLHLISRAPHLLAHFKLRWKAHLLYQAIKGRALWAQSVVEEELKSLLSARQLAGASLNELRPPLLATATDLRSLQLRTLQKEDLIVRSLLDSSALPFAFRGHKDEWVVDGGICENLPSSLLQERSEEYGKIVALGFAAEYPNPDRPKGVIEYCKSMLLAAMNNSVARAKEQLGDAYVKLRTDLTTFDFATALGRGLKDDYNETKRRAKEDLLKLLSRIREVKVQAARLNDQAWTAPNATDPVSVRYRSLQQSLGQMYRAQHGSVPVVYESITLRVIARGLEQGTARQRDEVHVVTELASAGPDCYCHKISIADAPHDIELDDSKIEVRDKNGNTLDDTTQVAITDSEDPLTREVLLFFSPVLTTKTGPYRVIYRAQIADYLRPLQADGRDELYIQATRETLAIKKAHIVISVPKGSGRFELSASHGQRMVGGQLNDYADRAPPGYDTYGFTATEVPKGERFTVRIVRN